MDAYTLTIRSPPHESTRTLPLHSKSIHTYIYILTPHIPNHLLVLFPFTPV